MWCFCHYWTFLLGSVIKNWKLQNKDHPTVYLYLFFYSTLPCLCVWHLLGKHCLWIICECIFKKCFFACGWLLWFYDPHPISFYVLVATVAHVWWWKCHCQCVIIYIYMVPQCCLRGNARVGVKLQCPRPYAGMRITTWSRAFGKSWRASRMIFSVRPL